jgi:hypothetical protein
MKGGGDAKSDWSQMARSRGAGCAVRRHWGGLGGRGPAQKFAGAGVYGSPPPGYVKAKAAWEVSADADPGTADTVAAEYARSTRAKVAATGGDVLGPGENYPVYVVVLHGSFTHRGYFGPPGSHAPHGNRIVITINRKLGILDYGIDNKGSAHDLSSIGPLIPFSLK